LTNTATSPLAGSGGLRKVCHGKELQESLDMEDTAITPPETGKVIIQARAAGSTIERRETTA
jgi:hypothetical protein